MKKIIFFLLLCASQQFCWSYPIPNAFPPFHIAGNLYYVGTEDLASYLVVTPKGNILINSNLEANVPMIKESIEKLGFKYRDTRILLVSHAHLDHAAGSKLIQEQTQAQYMVMDADVDVTQSGGTTDFHYAHDASMYFPATKVDKVMHDGDKVTLGGTVLTAHLTAGHTKGCTSWSMKVSDHGKTYNVVFVGSLSANPGYKLVNNKEYPQIAEDFERSINKLKSLPCDIFLGAHALYFDLKKKYADLAQKGADAFVDPQGYKHYIDVQEQAFKAELKRQQS